jgi:hypothetical protein
MAHFTKFWLSDLVEEVESLVRERVSIDHLLIVNIADSMFSRHHQVYQALQPADQQGTTPGHLCPQGSCVLPQNWLPEH